MRNYNSNINLIFISFYTFFLFSCQAKKQPLFVSPEVIDQWIDKKEDENYTARHECSFVQAGDKFILFGGRESSQKLDIYDFKNNSWSLAKNNAPKEFNHFQATFHKGFVWVIGAFKTNKFPKEIPEENVWLYYPPTDTWIKGPEIPENRRRGGAGLVVYKDKFYLIGGNTAGHDGGYVNWFDEYNPKENTWKILDNASQARDHFSAAVIGNTLYAVGGRHSGGEGGVFAPLISIVDTYNFETQTWSALENELPTPRAAPGVAVFNNKLLVMGGEGEKDKDAFKITEAYNPETKKWSRKADMNYPRHGTQAIVSGEGIYIAAGSPKRGGGRQLNMEVYNKDKPSGIPIKSSKLEVPEKIEFSSNSSDTILLKNSGGNTGTFINSIEIIQLGETTFKIKSDLNLTFIDANTELIIPIQHSRKLANDTDMLKIIYNGNIEKTLRLQ
jgi:hypothetical protein